MFQLVFPHCWEKKKKRLWRKQKKKKKLETWFLQWNENANVLFMEK